MEGSGISLLLERNKISIWVFRNKPLSAPVRWFRREKRNACVGKLCVALIDVLNDQMCSWSISIDSV